MADPDLRLNWMQIMLLLVSVSSTITVAYSLIGSSTSTTSYVLLFVNVSFQELFEIVYCVPFSSRVFTSNENMFSTA